MNGTGPGRGFLVAIALLCLQVAMVLGVLADRQWPWLGHGGSRGDARARFMQKITTELKLTPQQAHAVDSIFADQHTRIEGLRMRTATLIARDQDSLDMSLSRILSADQLRQLKEMRQKFMRHRGSRRRHPPGSQGSSPEGPAPAEPHPAETHEAPRGCGPATVPR